MEQRANYNKQNKIIISVRVDKVKPHKLPQYSPYTEGCLDVYKLLFKSHSDIFVNKHFVDYLKRLKDVDEDSASIFTEKDINYEIFENENFQDWLLDDDNEAEFWQKVCETQDKYLIRKHQSQEIYVVPLLNDDFDVQNVRYFETLVTALKKADDLLYLLLHDKDLYLEQNQCHNARVSDCFGFDLEEFPGLKKLILDRKVFVFIHEGKDAYYKCIVNKLKSLDLNSVIDILQQSLLSDD